MTNVDDYVSGYQEGETMEEALIKNDRIYCSQPYCINTSCAKNQIHTSLWNEYKWARFEGCESYVTQEEIMNLGWQEWLKSHKL